MAKSLPFVNLEELRKVRDLFDLGLEPESIRRHVDERIHYFEELHAGLDRDAKAHAPAGPAEEFTAGAHFPAAVKKAERPPTLELVE